MKIVYLILIILVIGILLYFLVASKNNNYKKLSPKGVNMKIESSSFQDSGAIPDKFTCKGKGVAPELFWSNFPEGTKSFALIAEDPDAPGGTFIHWVLYNIPSGVTSIPEGSTTILEASSAKNSGGKTDYYPPCPPSGKHRYIFKIFALSTEKIDGITEDNFYEKIKPYILDHAEITGLYGK